MNFVFYYYYYDDDYYYYYYYYYYHYDYDYDYEESSCFDSSSSFRFSILSRTFAPRVSDDFQGAAH